MDLNATCGSGSIPSTALSQIANCSGVCTPTPHRPPSAQSVLYLLTLALVVFASFVGNLLVLVAVIWTPSLHRTNNALMVSLAIADLLRTATVMPIHGYMRLTAENMVTISAGGDVCTIHNALLVGLDVAIVLSVTLIAMERVFIIVRPLRYICTVTRTKVCLTIGGIWAVSLVNGVIHIVRPHDNVIQLPQVTSLTSNSTTLTILNLKSCRHRMTSSFDAASYFIFLFALPLMVIVGCYGKIILVVGHQIRRMTNSTVNPNTREQSECRWQPENSLCENGGGQPEGCPPHVWVTVTARPVDGSVADGIQAERLDVARAVGKDLIRSSLVRFKDTSVKQLKRTMSTLRLPQVHQRRSRPVEHPVMPVILENYWKTRRKNKVASPIQSPPNLYRP